MRPRDMKPPVTGRAAVWATAISVSAVAPHVAPVALGLAAAKEGFDLLHARMHRTSVLSYLRGTAAGTYLSVDASGSAPGVVLQTASSLAGSQGDEEGAVPVPADDEPRRTGGNPDPGEFCIKHRDDWFGYALSHAGNRHDADDAVSHVVEKILTNHAKHGVICPLKYDDPVAWSKTVIANYIKDRNRRASVQRKYLSRLYSPSGEFDEDILDAMLVRQAYPFIEELKPRDHQIAVMHFVENLEPADIARRLGRKAGTVRTSLHRTRKKMRRELGIANEPQRTVPRETP
jgi:RNA polymerase sigma factor (sigma-70 family)